MIQHLTYHLNRGRKNKELNEIYTSMSIYTFALSLIMVFVPIHIYNLGYDLREIFSFYIYLYAFLGVFVVPACFLITRFGAKHVIAASLPITSVSLVLLLTLGNYRWPLWLIASFFGLSVALYWVAYHDDFSKAKHGKSAGRELSRMAILTSIAGALGPVIGGVVGQTLGLPFIMGVTAILLLVAVLPLFKTSEITKKRPIKKSNFNIKRNWKDILAYGGLGIESTASGIIWPLFIFILVGSFVRVGSITTIALLVMIAVTIYVGRLTDRYEKRKVLKAGTIINFFSCSSRALVTSLNQAYIISIFSSISLVFLNIPFMSAYYIRADEEPRIEYIMSMEVGINIMRVCGFLILFGATYFMETKMVLVLGFALGAAGVLLSMNIGKSSRKETATIKVHKEIAKVGA